MSGWHRQGWLVAMQGGPTEPSSSQGAIYASNVVGRCHTCDRIFWYDNLRSTCRHAARGRPGGGAGLHPGEPGRQHAQQYTAVVAPALHVCMQPAGALPIGSACGAFNSSCCSRDCRPVAVLSTPAQVWDSMEEAGQTVLLSARDSTAGVMRQRCGT